MSELQGKIALVTGGGRGIGREIALSLARAGCDVAVLARTSMEIEQVATEIQTLGRRSIAVASDLADGQAIDQAYDRVTRELGAIDILINNAAVATPVGPTETVEMEQWNQAIAINLTGVFRWIRLSLPHMLEQKWGRIVSLSSGAATGTGHKNSNAYTVSKAALEMLTLNLATEFKESGVTINAVRPGTVDTAMQAFIRSQPPEVIGASLHKQLTDYYQQGKLHSAELPARLILNLLKSESNGEIVNIYTQRGQELLGQA